MTFPDRETSQQEGLVASLFLFQYGEREGQHFAYTDIDEPVESGGIDYQPVVIGRSKVESSGGADEKNLEIEITPNAEIVTYLQTRTPTQQISLIIKQGHVGDPDEQFLVVWSGHIAASSREDIYYKIVCESVLAAMSRVGLRRTYQRACSWALYGPQCQARRRLFGPRKPLRVGRNVFSVAPGWNVGQVKEKFIGGYVEWPDSETGGEHQRTITAIAEEPSEEIISILGKVEGMSTDTDINFYLGCNHQLEDCVNLHNNVLNYGGQPYIPEENPVGYVNRYY